MIADISPTERLALRRADTLSRRNDVLETSVRRLVVAHNQGHGQPCLCERCITLRPLIAATDGFVIPATIPEERHMLPTADLRTTLTERFDAIGTETATIETDIAILSQRLAALVSERRAVRAAIAAYERALGIGDTSGDEHRPALRLRAYAGAVGAFVVKWFDDHDDEIIVRDAAAAGVAEGIWSEDQQARSSINAHLTSAPRRVAFVRTSKGVYRRIERGA